MGMDTPYQTENKFKLVGASKILLIKINLNIQEFMIIMRLMISKDSVLRKKGIFMLTILITVQHCRLIWQRQDNRTKIIQRVLTLTVGDLHLQLVLKLTQALMELDLLRKVIKVFLIQLQIPTKKYLRKTLRILTEKVNHLTGFLMKDKMIIKIMFYSKDTPMIQIDTAYVQELFQAEQLIY